MRKYLILLLAACIAQVSLAGSIENSKDFAEFVQAANSGRDLSKWSDEEGVVRLGADIDLKKVKSTRVEEFSGKFDGCGFRITGWETNKGLFGNLTDEAVVRNLTIDASCRLKGTQQEAGSAVGFIADNNRGTVEYCTNYGEIDYRVSSTRGSAVVGGLIGNNLAIVQNCTNYGDIEVSGDGNNNSGALVELMVGGIFGSNTMERLNKATALTCTNRGDIKVSANHTSIKVGGIAGFINRSNMVRCVNYGEIHTANTPDLAMEATSGEMTGGVVGGARTNVARCYNFGKVSSTSSVRGSYGGIIGYIHGVMLIGDCINRGPVTISSSMPAKIGGIVGVCSRPSFIKDNINEATITFTGSSRGEMSAVGGICGQVFAPKSQKKSAYINGCENLGNIEADQCDNVYQSMRSIHTGGICGSFSGKSVDEPGTAKHCVNRGEVRSASGRAGGLFGMLAFATALDCMNSGEVRTGGYVAGGICGIGRGVTIEECANSASVTSASAAKNKAAGVAGSLWYDEYSMVIHCSNSGDISGAFGYTGAIVAESSSEKSMIDGCFVGGTIGTAGSKNAPTEVSADNFAIMTVGRNTNANKATVGTMEKCVFLAKAAPENVSPTAVSSSHNVYGSVISTTGKPIAGVVVSDGLQCVTTDEAGHYEMTSDLKLRTLVYISLPDGYEMPAEDGCAMFYKKIDPFADSCEANFVLEPLEIDTKRHTIFMVGDPQIKQVGANGSAEMYGSMFIPALADRARKTEGLKYTINLGDLLHNDMTVYEYFVDCQARAGVTSLNAIGNHDFYQLALRDTLANAYYEMYLGPANYSVNVGNVHYVFINSIIYDREDSSHKYEEGMSEESIKWLAEDLKHVDSDKTIMLCAHAPMLMSTERTGADYINYDKYIGLFRRFKKVHTWGGHHHQFYNYVYPAGDPLEGFESHVVTRSIGTLYVNTPLNADGSPRGFSVVTVDGDDISWSFQPLSGDVPMEFRSYTPDRTGDGTVAVNVWNWDAFWKVEWIETDAQSAETSVEMERFTAVDYDWLEMMESVWASDNRWAARVGKEGNKTPHFFRIRPSSENVKSGTVRITDRFGKVHEETLSWM